MKKMSTVLLFYNLFASILVCSAYEAYIEEQDYILDIPENWYALDVNRTKVVITDPSNGAYFLSRYYPEKKSSRVEDFAAFVLNDLKANGDTALFDYKNKQAVFASYSFSADGFDFFGYGVFYIREDAALALLGFCDENSFDFYADYLLSILDSYSENTNDMLKPGPVSCFMRGEETEAPQRVKLNINSQPVDFLYNPALADASQWVVEREMKALSGYAADETGLEAWKRCYRLIYRDSFQQTAQLYSQIAAKVVRPENTDFQIADILLKWIQGFKYVRAEGSDFLNPASCAANLEGDCDSLGMLLVMLLKRFNIDAVLFTSEVYSHAMAGIALDIPGANMTHKGIKYVVAEVTDNVEMGLIDSQMANPAGWLAVDFH